MQTSEDSNLSEAVYDFLLCCFLIGSKPLLDQQEVLKEADGNSASIALYATAVSLCHPDQSLHLGL